MTDFQFKSIIKMVLSIARNSKDAETVVKELEGLIKEEDQDKQS